MSATAYAFIDGAAFDYQFDKIRHFFGASIEDLDWGKLTKNAQRIFYFDALPVKKEAETDAAFQSQFEAKLAKFSKLKRVDGLHVRQGFSRLRENSGRPRLEQKGVDIALSVEVLSHAYSENMETARLFLNDLDFLPLLEALTNTRVIGELYYDPRSTSKELIESADRSVALNAMEWYNCFRSETQQRLPIFGFDPSQWDGASLIASGQNLFGEVNVYRIGESFRVQGPTRTDLYNECCNVLPVIADRLEFYAQSPTKWSNGFDPMRTT
jgi:uncharacterized LabA/DUF88 family protein